MQQGEIMKSLEKRRQELMNTIRYLKGELNSLRQPDYERAFVLVIPAVDKYFPQKEPENPTIVGG